MSLFFLSSLPGEAVTDSSPRSRYTPIWLRPYGMAAGCTLAAGLLRLALQPWLSGRAPFFLLLPAVLLSVWYGGLGPGLLSLVLSMLLGVVLMQPYFSWQSHSTDNLINLGLFFLSAGMIVVMVEVERKARMRAERHAALALAGHEEAEEALARSLQRFEQVFHQTEAGLYLFNAEDFIVRVNHAFAHIFGYEPQEMEGQHASLILAPEDIEMNAQRLAALKRGEILEPREFGLIAKDGSRRYVRSSPTRVLNVDGEHLYLGTVIDITERRQVEDRLRESESRFRQLANAMPQIVWMARPDGYLDYFNERWYEFTGFPRGVGGDKSWEPILHPDDMQPAYDTWYEAVRTGESFQIEYRFKDRMSGGYRWFLARALPIKDAKDQVVRWFGTCTEIDDQKRMEQTQRFLAELSQKMRPLTDPIEVLGVAVNAIGRYLQVTHCTYAEIDLDKNQYVVYQDYHWQGETFAGVRPLDEFGTDIVEALKAGQTYVVQDTRTDSHTRPIYETVYQPANIGAFICVPLLKEGRLGAVLSVTLHGKPRVWKEEEISLLETAMEQTWLAVENARLYQAEHERSEQLAFAIQETHHRVKNNLQAVSALLELQITSDSALLPVETIRESLSQIKAIAIVHDLLSRNQPMGNVDAAQVLRNLAPLFSRGGRATPKPIVIALDTEPVWIPTKAATALALVVNELLTNCIKHGYALRKETSDSQDSIHVRLHKKDGKVLLSIQDRGPGFPPDFDPSLHAHIGLELVRTLVNSDLRGAVTFSNRSEQKDGGAHGGGRVEIVFPEQSLPE